MASICDHCGYLSIYYRNGKPCPRHTCPGKYWSGPGVTEIAKLSVDRRIQTIQMIKTAESYK